MAVSMVLSDTQGSGVTDSVDPACPTAWRSGIVGHTGMEDNIRQPGPSIYHVHDLYAGHHPLQLCKTQPLVQEEYNTSPVVKMSRSWQTA